VHILTLET